MIPESVLKGLRSAVGDDGLIHRLDEWINPAGPLWLPAPHDGTVSVESTRLRGMRDHIVLPYTHTFIVAAGPVADQVDRFLRHGAFEHEVEAERNMSGIYVEARDKETGATHEAMLWGLDQSGRQRLIFDVGVVGKDSCCS